MNPVPLVIALAIGWHVSLLWIERSRQSPTTKPSLTELLRFIELDLLRALRAELMRLLRAKSESCYEQKLREVDHRLQELGGHHAA